MRKIAVLILLLMGQGTLALADSCLHLTCNIDLGTNKPTSRYFLVDICRGENPGVYTYQSWNAEGEQKTPGIGPITASKKTIYQEGGETRTYKAIYGDTIYSVDYYVDEPAFLLKVNNSPLRLCTEPSILPDYGFFGD